MPRVPECAVNRTARRTQSCPAIQPTEPSRAKTPLHATSTDQAQGRHGAHFGRSGVPWSGRVFSATAAKFVARETRAADLRLPARVDCGISSSNINHQFLLSGLGIEQTATRRAHVRGPPRCRLKLCPSSASQTGLPALPMARRPDQRTHDHGAGYPVRRQPDSAAGREALRLRTHAAGHPPRHDLHRRWSHRAKSSTSEKTSWSASCQREPARTPRCRCWSPRLRRASACRQPPPTAADQAQHRADPDRR